MKLDSTFNNLLDQPFDGWMLERRTPAQHCKQHCTRAPYILSKAAIFLARKHFRTGILGISYIGFQKLPVGVNVAKTEFGYLNYKIFI